MWGRAEQAASSLQKATRGSFVLSEQGQRGWKSETSKQQAGNLGAIRPPPAVRGPRRVSRQPSPTPPEGRFSCSQPACASRGAHRVPHLSPPETGRMCLALRGPGRPPQILRAAPQEVWLLMSSTPRTQLSEASGQPPSAATTLCTHPLRPPGPAQECRPGAALPASTPARIPAAGSLLDSDPGVPGKEKVPWWGVPLDSVTVRIA